jgi:hypothetical protein
MIPYSDRLDPLATWQLHAVVACDALAACVALIAMIIWLMYHANSNEGITRPHAYLALGQCASLHPSGLVTRLNEAVPDVRSRNQSNGQTPWQEPQKTTTC